MYIYIVQNNLVFFFFNENIKILEITTIVCTIMYSSTGCEHTIQNDMIISVVFIYYFNLAIFLHIYIVSNKKNREEEKKENQQIHVKAYKKYSKWVEKFKGLSL